MIERGTIEFGLTVMDENSSGYCAMSDLDKARKYLQADCIDSEANKRIEFNKGFTALKRMMKYSSSKSDVSQTSRMIAECEKSLSRSACRCESSTALNIIKSKSQYLDSAKERFYNKQKKIDETFTNPMQWISEAYLDDIREYDDDSYDETCIASCGGCDYSEAYDDALRDYEYYNGKAIATDEIPQETMPALKAVVIVAKNRDEIDNAANLCIQHYSVDASCGREVNGLISTLNEKRMYCDREIDESFKNFKQSIKENEDILEESARKKSNNIKDFLKYGKFDQLKKLYVDTVNKKSLTQTDVAVLVKKASSDIKLCENFITDLTLIEQGKATKFNVKQDIQFMLNHKVTVYKLQSFKKFIQTTILPTLNKRSRALRESVVVNESVGQRRIFYRLSESEMFQNANRMAKISGQEVINVIPRMVVEGEGFTQLTFANFDPTVVYELFESNRYKITCKKQMKTMLDSGKVVMVFGEEYRMPTCIPYVIKSQNKNTQIFVNITPFVTIDQYGKIKVNQLRNYSGLMALLFAGCAAYTIAAHNMELPADAADGLILMYAGMLTKTINSLVHCDSIQKETVRYLSAEFALVQMYGSEDGMRIFQRYREKYFPKLGNLIVNSIDDTFSIDAFDNMTLFVEELKKNYPIMKGLTVPNIVEKWMRNYGSATALSLDYLGYHLYTFIMLLFESPLITRISLEPLVDQKRGSDAFKRFQQMIENYS